MLFILNDLLGQLKRRLPIRYSRKSLGRSNNDTSLEMGLWRRFNPILPSAVAVRLLIIIMIKNCWFSRLLWRWGKGMGLGNVKMAQRSLLLSIFKQFSQINIHKVIAAISLISRVLKKLILIIFANVLIVFVEERLFEGTFFFPSIPADVSIFTKSSLNSTYMVQPIQFLVLIAWSLLKMLIKMDDCKH